MNYPPVSLLIDPLHLVDVDEFDFEEELAHLGDVMIGACRPSEALQVIPSQNEIAFLPAREQFISLLPQKTALYRRVVPRL